jgi:hypothetical protein
MGNPPEGTVINFGGGSIAIVHLELILHKLREHGEVHVVNANKDDIVTLLEVVAYANAEKQNV